MAQKDHSLDDQIIAAATAEFLEHGFQQASLRKIAQRAGLSTGAVYTRYESKDVLFRSLVKQALGEIHTDFKPLQQMYLEARQSCDPEKFVEAMRQEETVYLNLMFEYYDQCILFFCRSDGSSVQSMLDSFLEKKSRDTIAFFKSIAKQETDFDGIALILAEQFRYYRLILEKGYDKEKAISCMKTVEAFMEAGWRQLFERIL